MITGLTGNQLGMIQPALSNKFIAQFKYADISPEYLNALSRQVVSVAINLKTSNLTLTIEQSIEGELLKAVQAIISKASAFNSNNITVAIIDGNENIFANLVFSSLEVVSHDFKFDYAKNGAAIHTMVFKFKNFNTEQLSDGRIDFGSK